MTGQQVCRGQEACEGCRQGRSNLATDRRDNEACGSTRECRTFAEWLKFEFALKNQRGLGTNGDADKWLGPIRPAINVSTNWTTAPPGSQEG